jgi:hypothetical protein
LKVFLQLFCNLNIPQILSFHFSFCNLLAKLRKYKLLQPRVSADNSHMLERKWGPHQFTTAKAFFTFLFLIYEYEQNLVIKKATVAGRQS